MLKITLLTTTAAFLSSSIHAKELKQLIFLWRHGDRSPVRSYPNYEKQFHQNFSKIWPHGPGQLTIHGMKQHFELGTYLHKTYEDFIPDNFNPNEIYIRSTDVDRTLMSAQSNAAAMFPAQDRTDTGNSPIDIHSNLFEQWMPLPIHTIPRSEEEILSFPIREDRCPKYAEYALKARQTPKFLEYQRKYAEFLSDIREKGGFPEPFGLADEWEFFDPIYCTFVHNFTMPEWFNKPMLDELLEIWALGAYALFSDFENELHTAMTRIGSGNLIKQLQTDMRQMLRPNTLSDGPDGGDPTLPHKLKIYSAHDTTIVALLVALKQYNFKQPPYASALIFEVYDDESIVFKFRNDTTREPYQLQLCQGSDSCDFDEFVKQKSYLIAEDWAAECGAKTITPAKHASATLLLTTILLATWFGIGAFFVYNRVKYQAATPYEGLEDHGLH